ncbi:PREDICTED: protein FAM210B [Cyprinodon variegatus]|uniref:Family with sequence similarity 210 member B n=1 Tax=Cyprinodon variegatus TaxID=28743 RepID=A0A3Q2DXQ2_CYPVA|nr:PREDICTED: protein FAM210B [Cyprinodon variegatus]
MFLCRAGRLPASVLDQAYKRPGWFVVRVKASGPGEVSLTGRTGRSFQRLRFLSACAGELQPKHAHQQAEPVQKWDSSACLVTDWGLLERVAPRSIQRFSNSMLRGDSKALFPGDTSMQTRAASTSAATRSREERADSSKADLQDASSTSSQEKDPGNTPEPEEGKPNKTQQLKKVFKEYGAVGVSFHIGISLMSLGMFYLLISSGIDMAAMLCKLGFSEELVQSKMAAGTSTFVLAYAIHKLFAPVRISITVVSVPLIVRYLRKTGLFKPPTPSP